MSLIKIRFKKLNIQFKIFSTRKKISTKFEMINKEQMNMFCEIHSNKE